jgi:hypothetical protein
MQFNFTIIACDTGAEETFQVCADSIAEAAAKVERAWANCIRIEEVR